jgi:transcriptional regulator with XRE-family HTH domain
LLAQLRESQGVRQTELSGKLGKPQSFVSKYENGERRLDVLELREVCLALGITLTQFAQKLEKEISKKNPF